MASSGRRAPLGCVAPDVVGGGAGFELGGGAPEPDPDPVQAVVTSVTRARSASPPHPFGPRGTLIDATAGGGRLRARRAPRVRRETSARRPHGRRSPRS